MNRTGIEWCDFTWNPITGCLHGCPYCYARRLAEGRLKGNSHTDYARCGFRPTFHQDRVVDPLGMKKPAAIFCGSMGDLLGDWKWQSVSGLLASGWVVSEVADVMRATPQHSYVVLTKADLNDDRVQRNAEILSATGGAWVGVSVTLAHDRENIERERIYGLMRSEVKKRVVSVEPCLGSSPFQLDALEDLMARTTDDPEQSLWIIVGGLTGKLDFKIDVQGFRAVLRLTCRYEVPVFVKNNAGDMQHIKQFPEGYVCRKA